AVSMRWGRAGEKTNRQWLWVPAFAGVTPRNLLRSRRCGRRDCTAVVDAEAAEAGEFYPRMAQVDPGYQAEEVELDSLDPAELDAKNAPQRGLDAGATVGSASIRTAAELLAD